MAEREIETAERIAVLEFQVRLMQITVEETNKKLDQLLELKTKGMGAVWLVSLLFGSGLLGLFAWFKG